MCIYSLQGCEIPPANCLLHHQVSTVHVLWGKQRFCETVNIFYTTLRTEGWQSTPIKQLCSAYKPLLHAKAAPMSVLMFPHHSSAQHPHSPSRAYNNAETKQVLSMWCLCCREVSASLEHIYQVPIRMGTPCSQSSPPSLLSISLSQSLVLGQWLLLIHVWCLVASSALVSSALFQATIAGVSAGIAIGLLWVLFQQFFTAFSF